MQLQTSRVTRPCRWVLHLCSRACPDPTPDAGGAGARLQRERPAGTQARQHDRCHKAGAARAHSVACLWSRHSVLRQLGRR